MRKSLLWIFLIPLLCQPLIPQQKITAADAKNHMGEEATVCGYVASARFASSTRGQPTFLNLEKPYPNQIFTVLIWGVDLVTVREIMRLKSIEMTLRYAHLAPAHKRGAIDALESALLSKEEEKANESKTA